MDNIWKDLCIAGYKIFSKKNELIFLLQFWFQLKHLITDALIHSTDKIRNENDKGNYACGIFVDF